MLELRLPLRRRQRGELARLAANVALQNQLGIPSRLVTRAEAARAGRRALGRTGSRARPSAPRTATSTGRRASSRRSPRRARAGVRSSRSRRDGTRARRRRLAAALARRRRGSRRLRRRRRRLRHARRARVARGRAADREGAAVPLLQRRRSRSGCSSRSWSPPSGTSPRSSSPTAACWRATSAPTAIAEAGRAHWRANVAPRRSRSCCRSLEFVSFPVLVEGFYDVTPDHQPILGAVHGLDGLWLAAGFSGHGFMMAPAVGRRLAAAISGGRRSVPHRAVPQPLQRPGARPRAPDRVGAEMTRPRERSRHAHCRFIRLRRTPRTTSRRARDDLRRDGRRACGGRDRDRRDELVERERHARDRQLVRDPDRRPAARIRPDRFDRRSRDVRHARHVQGRGHDAGARGSRRRGRHRTARSCSPSTCARASSSPTARRSPRPTSSSASAG